jgi:hypothetical protein
MINRGLTPSGPGRALALAKWKMPFNPDALHNFPKAVHYKDWQTECEMADSWLS